MIGRCSFLSYRGVRRAGVLAAAFCLPGVAAAAQSIATANLGANQMTLELTSAATGTGYFALLAGSGTTCGSAAINGSLPLTANTPGNYTVRDLMASTAYTVCFMPDGTTAPMSTNVTTAAANVLSSGAWGNVGRAGFSAGEADFVSLAFSPDGTPVRERQ